MKTPTPLEEYQVWYLYRVFLMSITTGIILLSGQKYFYIKILLESILGSSVLIYLNQLNFLLGLPNGSKTLDPKKVFSLFILIKNMKCFI